MKVYQLSKLAGYYRWTGTIESDHVPNEDMDYYWTSDKKECLRLTNTKIR